MSQNLSSAAVVIGVLRVKILHGARLNSCYTFRIASNKGTDQTAQVHTVCYRNILKGPTDNTQQTTFGRD